MKMQLLQVQDRNQWQVYHAIRRHVLFELRGQADYDEGHPDEHRENHLPLLFIYDDVPVGTVRLDIGLVGTDPGTVRLVAIIPQYQRQGIGRAMMHALERLAADKGITRLEVHAAPDAVAFYEKLGWLVVDADRAVPLLTKQIS
jgi:GNAT superfamily N-acetyltransferase